jgi:hypothetical protein
LFATYVEYHLRRLELFSQMCDLVAANKQAAEKPEGLDEPLRQQLLSLHREVYALAGACEHQAATVPGQMLDRTRAMELMRPFKAFVNGYDQSLDGLLEVKQFAGTMIVSPSDLAAGQPFALRVELQNTGVCPWLPGVGHRLALGGDAARLGLPTE